VRLWVTVNEPNVFGRFGYLDGTWPPHQTRELRSYLRHMNGCARGHRAARAALQAQNRAASAGIAYSIHPLEPLRHSHALDRLAVRLFDWLWQGRLFARTIPHADWVGVNYYFRVVVEWDGRPWKLFARSHMGPGQKTDFGWEIFPRGLYQTLRRVGKFGKPVMVTENGIADANDTWRAEFIVQHLAEAHRALQDGVDLRGYLHWSLLDNFEWAEGYTRRFGLAAVEFEDPVKKRRLRPSASVYARIARANMIPSDLMSARPG
jgi:beta-glucosidase